MNSERPRLRVFLDEGVPVKVGGVFAANGHDVIHFADAVKRGSPDILVCKAAQENDAILVAFDKDMKAAAGRQGIGPSRFKRLNLIRFSCPEPKAAMRLEHAMSLIEHEWTISDEKVARRLFVEVGASFLKTYR